MLEQHLASEKETARYCHGNAVTIADVCLVSHVAGANFFHVDLSPYPTVKRITDACMAINAFAGAHPLKQPGAPVTV